MPHTKPIIIVEDDLDDQELLKEVFQELIIPNALKIFSNCREVLEYLMSTIENPFLIISDINLPGMTGLELKRQIDEDHKLKKKNIPFVFLSTNADNKTITEAYEMKVHGIFRKPTNIQAIRETIKMIMDYWRLSLRPAF